jgi:hypothetical protein
MFIKRFYLELIKKYFKTANFVKPTGDGLLMTFNYTEKNLEKVSAMIVSACMACLNDFPTICRDDPMINFEVPSAIGFGIARGTACCLYSGEVTLDYSGHLLNLASRLNDLARPSGIVIDGSFLKELIPTTLRLMFKEQKVFVRSIAEEAPINVFYLDKFVQIPEGALRPLIGEHWRTQYIAFTPKQLTKITGNFLVNLSGAVESERKIKVSLLWPTGKGSKKGSHHHRDFYDFTYISRGPESQISLDIEKAKTYLPDGNTKTIKFKIDYVLKTLSRT